jgi:hypothetical protein
MKFAEKYELLDSLTTGAVETFFANDKVRGERVLVHIFRCDPRQPNQPTVQWVLEAFRRVAPEPIGLVLETGPYSGTLYAYLVTKLPDDGALRVWVLQYEARPRDTQEIPAPVPKPAPESAAPRPDITPRQSPPVPGPVTPGPVTPGPVTQLLRSFDLPPKPGAPSAPAKVTEQPYQPPSPHPSSPQPSLPQPPPNISPAAERSPVRMAPVPTAPERNPAIPRPSVLSGADPDANSPESSFRPGLPPKSIPSEVFTPPVIDTPMDKPKPGEFTSVFQGPFHGDAPSDIPALSTQKMEPPRKTVGDFTAMFGAVKPQKEEPLPASGVAGNESAGTGFTGFFNSDMAARNSSTSAPTPPILPAPQIFPAPQVFATPQVFPTPPSPNPPMPASPVVVPSTLPADGATGAFSSPASKPAPTLPPMPGGPSAYTQIISLKTARPLEDSADADEMTPGNSAEPPAFPPPVMPAVPKAPKMPPVPKAPATPKMPAAKMPKIAIPPSAPKPPKEAGLPPPPVPYWPLILTLTVLFFIGVLLVLYFALKH